MTRGVLAALLALSIAAVALVATQALAAGHDGQGWAPLGWCPCSSTGDSVESRSIVGLGDYAVLLGDSGTLYLLTPRGLEGPWGPGGIAALTQISWGSTPSGIVLLGERSAGAVVPGSQGRPLLWLSALYSRPLPETLWVDPSRGIAWVVDVAGNLYRGVVGGSWRILLGPAASTSSLGSNVSEALLGLAEEYVEEEALSAHPNSTLLESGAAPLGEVRVDWAGAIYSVGGGYAYPDSSMVPVSASLGVRAWALLDTPSGRVNYTRTVDVRAVLLLDIAEQPRFLGLYDKWGPGRGGPPTALVGAWSSGQGVGIAAAPYRVAGGWRIVLYVMEGSPLNVEERDKPILDIGAPPHSIQPVSDPSTGRPSLAVAGTNTLYYFEYVEHGSTLAWAVEPFPDGSIDGITPTPWGILVVGAGGAQMLSYHDGEALWGRSGLPLPALAAAPLDWGVALPIRGGGVVVVREPAALVELEVRVQASRHPLGPGFRVNLTQGEAAYTAVTDPQGLARFWVPPGTYTIAGFDPLIGGCSKQINASGPIAVASLEYDVTVAKVVVYKGGDPLGLLPGGPASGASGVLGAPWGLVSVWVDENGSLRVELPQYLSWASEGVPLNASAPYTLRIGLPGYREYSGPPAPSIVLEPVLVKVGLNVADSLTGETLPFNATLTLLTTGRTAHVSGQGIIEVGLPPGPYVVEVESPAYDRWNGTIDVRVPMNISVRLERAKSALTLYIIDRDYGFPLNATVNLEGPLSLSVAVRGSTSLTLPWGEYLVSAEAPGYRLWESTLSLEPGGNASLLVMMEPEWYNVTLIVRDALTGEPINFTATGYAITPEGRVAVSRASGAGETIIKLRPWNATVEVEAPGYHAVTVAAPGPSAITVRLERVSATLVLRVVDSIVGEPVNATLQLRGPGGLGDTVTASTGEAVVELPWGTYNITVYAEGFAEESLEVQLAPGGRSSTVITLQPLMRRIEVKVVDPYSGAPLLFNYTITIRTPLGERPLSCGVAYGSVIVEAPEPWESLIHVSAHGYQPVSEILEGGEVVISPPRLKVPVAVRIVDFETGAEVEGAVARLKLGSLEVTMASGYWVRLPWGTYTVVVSARYYAQTTYTVTVGLESNETIVIPAERLRVPVTIRVADNLTGSLVYNVTVVAVSTESGDKVTAFGQGTVTLRLRAGEDYRIVVGGLGYKPITITTGPLRGPESFSLSLERAHVRAVVKVVDAVTGAPVSGARVKLYSPWAAYETATSPDGEAVVLLPWGTYNVRVEAVHYETLESAIWVSPASPAEPVGPYTFSLRRPEVRVTLSVVDAETGEPLAASVEVRGPIPEPLSLNITGNTTLTLPEGVYSVSVSAPGYASLQATLDATGPANVTLNLKRLYSRVTIRIYDRETGLPVPARVTLVNSVYGEREIVDAPGGTAAVLLLRGIRYTITVSPLSPYYYPAVIDLVIPVNRPSYYEIVQLEKPSYNVTLVPVDRGGRIIEDALVVVEGGGVKATISPGETISLPAGSYTVTVYAGEKEYVSRINVTGPGVIIVRIEARIFPLHLIAILTVVGASALAAAWLLRRIWSREGASEEFLPSYDEIIGG